jgi:hypothetical protein
MVGDIERAVEKLAEFLGDTWWVNMEDGIKRLGRGHMMGFRTDAADALGNLWHVFSKPPFAEPLETPEFRNLEIAVGYRPLVVKENLNLGVALEPGYRVNRYLVHFTLALLSSESGRL